MATQRPLPRQTLAKNLRALMARAEISAPEVARRAGVDAKTLNNMIHGRYDPRPEKVEQVAAVFGLQNWHLLMPNLPVDSLQTSALAELIANYALASAEGRDSISRVAEMAARYHKGE